MDRANISLRLGGHQGNTIQKFLVTPGEIAVLQLIHGDESVYDVDYVDEVQRSSRAELERLHAIYGQRQADGSVASGAVGRLFPGIAARVFDKLEEIGLDETYVKSLGPSVKVNREPDKVQPINTPLEQMNKTQLLQIASERNIEVSDRDKKSEIIDKINAAPPLAPPVDDDEEMDDAKMFE